MAVVDELIELKSATLASIEGAADTQALEAVKAKGLEIEKGKESWGDLLAQLEEREALASTALPGGIALPHPHHQDPYLITEPFMLLARTRKPIWFGAPDDAPTDLFCLICCCIIY